MQTLADYLRHTWEFGAQTPGWRQGAFSPVLPVANNTWFVTTPRR